MALREQEHLSLTQTQEWSPLPAGQSLFDTIFVYESTANLPKAKTFSLSHWQHSEQSHYPLAALALPGDALTLLIIADSSLHATEALQPVLDCWTAVLKSIIRQEKIEWMSEETRKEVLKDWNATTDPALPEPRIRPYATAVVVGNERLTYRELECRSNQLAHRLIQEGVSKGGRVGILANRSLEMIVAIQGVLKAGASYIPLDPSYPKARLKSMVTDSAMQYLCFPLTLLGTFDLTNLCVIPIDEDNLAEQPTSSPDVETRSSDPPPM